MKPENAAAKVWKSPLMSEGAACASAWISVDSVWSAFPELPEAATAAAALAARPARSWQFFALAKLGVELELLEVVVTFALVVVADCVVEGEFPPPPQPAATVTSPVTSAAAASCFGLGVM